jgi:hypothetical protein
MFTRCGCREPAVMGEPQQCAFRKLDGMKRAVLTSGVDEAEQGEREKWADVLDRLGNVSGGFERVLREARECRHPDAVWLVSLFPAGETVTRKRAREVLLEQGEDPRALFFVARLSKNDKEKMERSARLGYAPAQVMMSLRSDTVDCFKWASLAAENGDRGGLCELGRRYRYGLGCAADRDKAIDLFRQSAELGDAAAQGMYAEIGFGKFDWQRFHWWARASRRSLAGYFCSAVCDLAPLFQQGQHSRIVHEVAPVIRKNLDSDVASYRIEEPMARELRRVLKVHEVMTARGRDAIACWSMCALRLGMVKDMRVVIAMLVWAEPWRWSGI